MAVAKAAALATNATVAPELAVSRTVLGLDYGSSVIANTRRVELVARKVTGSSRKRSPSSPNVLRPIDE